MKNKMIVSLIMSLSVAPAFAADNEDVSNTVKQLEQKIEQLENSYSELSKLTMKLQSRVLSSISEDGKWIGDKSGLVGPKGDKGNKGDKGEKGEQGVAGTNANICDMVVALQGRSGSGHYIGENGGEVYAKAMDNPKAWEKFMLRCQ